MARMLGLSGRDGCGWSLGGSRGGARKIKRHREQREFARSLLPTDRLVVATDVLRDCVHGCDGECELYGGNGECTFVCHPGPYLLAVETDADRAYVSGLWRAELGAGARGSARPRCGG